MRNLIKTYQEKDSMFECGFHSFQQSRSPFNIAFFIYALVYLLLDLEILLTFPFAVSEYVNNVYGLIVHWVYNYYYYRFCIWTRKGSFKNTFKTIYIYNKNSTFNSYIIYKG